MNIKFDKLAIVFDPADVRAGNPGAQRAVQMLKSTLLLPPSVKDYERKVSFALDGYDADRRELQEIAEVRAFVQSVDRDFPYWFHFCDLDDLWLRTVLLCSITFERQGAAQWQINPNEFSEFVMRHVLAVVKLRLKYDLPRIDAAALTNEMIAYYTGGR